jgi:hypothetical protein
MTYKILKALVEKNGYLFFDEGNLNLNIVGVRSKNRKAGRFDDMIYVAYRHLGKECLYAMKATVDPGRKYLLAPLNKKGTAIIAPGQYKGVYKIGIHGRSWKSGGYRALEQVQPMFYYRDNNKDDVIDFDDWDQFKKCVYENGKTNIHRASRSKIVEWVGGYSAGCQVIQNYKKFQQFMYLCERSAKLYGNRFTYTLIQQ